MKVLLTGAHGFVGTYVQAALACAPLSRGADLTEISLGLRAPILSVGDIDVTRDFTDVRDVVSQYKLVLQRGQNGSVYNVCSGHEHSVRELLQRLINFAGIEVS